MTASPKPNLISNSIAKLPIRSPASRMRQRRSWTSSFDLQEWPPRAAIGVIERDIAAVARSANRGLIVTQTASAGVNRDLIITLATQHNCRGVLQSLGGLSSSRTASTNRNPLREIVGLTRVARLSAIAERAALQRSICSTASALLPVGRFLRTLLRLGAKCVNR